MTIIITTRADLDAVKGTPAHSQFMDMLSGTIFRAEKDDESKCWRVVEDASMIARFGFARADFPGATPPALPDYFEPAKESVNPKMVGVEFEGVMCSATKDDQAGLIAVLMATQLQGAAFKPTRYDFSNGTTLVLTKENIAAFAAVWMPFRQSFFAVAA